MLTLTVNATGKTFDDLAMAIDQVKVALDGACWSGMDGNDDGDYYFDVEGIEDEEEGEEEEEEEDNAELE